MAVAALLSLTATAAWAETLSAPIADVVRSDGLSYNGGGGAAGADHFTGFSVGSNPGIEGRGYFIFTIPVGQTVTGATLELNGAIVDNAPAAFTIHPVTASAATVSAPHSADAAGIAVFTDLGDGAAYGGGTYTANGQTLQFTLNASAIAAINAAQGGTFIVGFKKTVDATPGAQDGIFAGSQNSLPRNLILTRAAPAPVPTLSEWAMILFGLALAGSAALYLQRRRQFV
ncbi:IPTL-CTERM sorting domain-containing protein [Brevundimonas sp.]|uniref:IPTL-CTERM sorting domain-containing protein n=1 Tax=Brevundimonas sp. TaxID=1871086 RepID=UPI003D0AD980